MRQVAIGWVLIAAIAGASDKGLMPQWVETDVSGYAGEYVLHEQDAKDPYLYVVSRITLKQTAAGWTATYKTAVQKNGIDSASQSAELTNVTVSEKGFSANPVAVRKAWPGYLPSTFHGFFATKYPPGNTKGAVKNGIQLADRKFFEKI